MWKTVRVIVEHHLISVIVPLENINEKNRIYKATMSQIFVTELVYRFTMKLIPFGYFLYHQAPAVDVVGVGLQSGKIILHNLKFDEVVMSFHQDWGPVTALTFRTGIIATTKVEVNVCFEKSN